jgi:hypothetical protein
MDTAAGKLVAQLSLRLNIPGNLLALHGRSTV